MSCAPHPSSVFHALAAATSYDRRGCWRLARPFHPQTDDTTGENMAKATSAKPRIPKASTNGAGSAGSLATVPSSPGRSARMAAISAVTNYRPSAPPMKVIMAMSLPELIKASAPSSPVKSMVVIPLPRLVS